MAYGISISGFNGVTQIDGSNLNYVLIQKFSLTAVYGASSSPNVGGTYSSYFSAKKPIVFMNNPNSVVVWCRLIYSSTYGWKVLVKTPASGNTALVTCYVFDQVNQTSSSGTGLVVYGSNGSTVYDSSAKPLRIMATHKLGDNYASAESSTISAPYSSTWACCMSQPYGVFITNGYIGYFVETGLKTSATVCTLGETAVGTLPMPDDIPYQPFGGLLMFADVTGY